jgi:hypothetical protein
MSGTAVAAVNISGDATYSGFNTSTQQINVSSTVSPDSVLVTDVEIQISGTQRTFLDTESFQTTINPGNSNVNVVYEGDGQFNIDELSPDESVTIEFVVYPRTIQEESIKAAQVDVSFVQNGQELTDRKPIDVSLTDSAFFKYQQLDGQEQQRNLIDLAGRAALVILGLSLLGGGFVFYRRRGGDDDGRTRRSR